MSNCLPVFWTLQDQAWPWQNNECPLHLLSVVQINCIHFFLLCSSRFFTVTSTPTQSSPVRHEPTRDPFLSMTFLKRIVQHSTWTKLYVFIPFICFSICSSDEDKPVVSTRMCWLEISPLRKQIEGKGGCVSPNQMSDYVSSLFFPTGAKVLWGTCLLLFRVYTLGAVSHGSAKNSLFLLPSTSQKRVSRSVPRWFCGDSIHSFAFH